MNIYGMNNKDLKKHFREFGRTTYGKVVFCLSYAIPAILFLICIELAVLSRVYCCISCFQGSVIIVMLLALLISFILGTRYFYREFKDFLKSKSE